MIDFQVYLDNGAQVFIDTFISKLLFLQSPSLNKDHKIVLYLNYLDVHRIR